MKQPKSGAICRLLNKTTTRAEIDIRGPIGGDFFGDGITSKQLSAVLRQIPNVKTIDVYVESPGGLVTEGRAMYDMFVRHPARVQMHIEGIAASAASFLVMAGDTIDITEGSLFMIHEARVYARDMTKGDLRKLANTIEVVDGIIADTYAARTGIKRAKIDAWMEEEKFFSGKEAVEHGFVDTLIANKVKVAASLEYLPDGWFRNAPATLRPRRAAVLEFKRKLENAR